jgi:hypothetical protein
LIRGVKSRDRVVRTIRAAGKASFAAVALAAILSCSQANVEGEQKWLSFRCPDGQTVMAQFHLPDDQFVNVRFAGREFAPAARDLGLGRALQRRQDNLLEPRQERAYGSRRQSHCARLHAARRAARLVFSAVRSGLRNTQGERERRCRGAIHCARFRLVQAVTRFMSVKRAR